MVNETRNKGSRFTADIFIDAGLLILGICFMVLVSDYPDMARTFPELVLTMIMVVTILDILSKFWKKTNRASLREEEGERAEPAHTHKTKVFYMVILIFLFLASLLIFGLPLGVFIFLFFSAWTLGYRRPVVLAVSSVAVTGFVYVIFEVIMNSMLPKGLLFNLLGG